MFGLKRTCPQADSNKTKPIYQASFKKCIRIQFGEFSERKVETYKGEGRIMEFSNSDFLVIAWNLGTVSLVQKTLIDSVNLDVEDV